MRHTGNVVFDRTHPYFVDFGSIVPMGATSSLPSWVDQFQRSFWNPLLLMESGLGETARYLMYDWRGIRAEQVRGITGYPWEGFGTSRASGDGQGDR